MGHKPLVRKVTGSKGENASTIGQYRHSFKPNLNNIIICFLLYDDLKERTITGQYGNSKTEISYSGMEHLHHFSFFQVSRIIMGYRAEGV